jgi:hypothetical protein
MKTSIAMVALGGVCATLAACGGAPPAPTPSAKPAVAPAQVAAVRPGEAAPQAGSNLVPATPQIPAGEAPKYEDKGRKDPFVEVQVTTISGGLSVITTKLTGIVRGARSTLALVETQEGIGYILKPGDTLGDGRLMEIGADNVVFAVGPKGGAPAQRVVLRLAAN